MAMEPLPLGFGDFSITMDTSLASLWPPTPLAMDGAHCYQHIQSVEEVKQRLAAATAELGAVREEVRRKEQNIAALVELIRRTAEERDLLRQQHHLLLARELGAAASSSGDPGRSPLPSPSPVTVVDRPAMFKPFAVPSPAPGAAEDRGAVAAAQLAAKRPTGLFEPSYVAHSAAVVENRSAAAVVAQLEMLAAKSPLPKKGRLVQAVMDSAPLLQNMLVAGPLPRWRNPPLAQALTNAMISAPSVYGAQIGLPWSTH